MDVDAKQENNSESKEIDDKTEDPSHRIERYLKEKRSIRFATIEGISFLRYCIAMIDEELAIEIVKNGINLDINEPWDNGQTPLHFACQMDMIYLIQIMLKHKSSKLNLYAITDDFLVQFNDFQPGGKTALHYSAINGSLKICKLLIEYEQNQLKQNELLFIKDNQGNDALDDAIMHRKFDCARYLLSLRTDLGLIENMEEWLKLKEMELSKKRLKDSKETRLRFEKFNKDLIESNDDLLNKVFILKNLWTKQRCHDILSKVKNFGVKHGWTTKRHRSYATTDIPSHMIDYELDEYLRELLYDTLYPKMVEKYKFNERFNVNLNNGEYFEIGVRDLFFVKYDLLKQNELKLHRDGSLVSFNILLNDKCEFEGGGTYFEHLDKVYEIEKGDCVIHSGKVLHAGYPILSGERYILVGFLDGKVRRNSDKFVKINECVTTYSNNYNESDFHCIKSF